jgi:hypothetical protein
VQQRTDRRLAPIEDRGRAGLAQELLLALAADGPAGAPLALEHDRLDAPLAELVGDHEAGQPSAHDQAAHLYTVRENVGRDPAP